MSKQNRGASLGTFGAQNGLNEDAPTIPSLPNIQQQSSTSSSTKATSQTEASTPHHSMQDPTQEAEASTPVKTETITANASRPESKDATSTAVKAETAIIDASHPGLNEADTTLTANHQDSQTSSIEIITEAPQKSCWSQAMDADPGWDNETADLSTPAWMKSAPVTLIPGMPVRANLALLPPYKFPQSKKTQEIASTSFNRQLAGIKNEASPNGTFPHLQPSPHIQSTPTEPGSHKYSTSSLAKNIEEKAVLRGQNVPQSEKAPATPKEQNASLPPHLRTPDSARVASSLGKTPTDKEVKLLPHLRTPVSRVTPSPKTNHDETHEVHAEAPKNTITAECDNTVPSKSNDTANHKSRWHEGNVSYQPTLNVDEEVAASLGIINKLDYDEEVAAGLQAESFNHEVPLQPAQIAAGVLTESFYDQVSPKPPQHLGNGAGNHAYGQQHSTPSHVKASKTASRASMLQEVTKSRHNSNVHPRSTNDARGNGVESAVKAGKRPARTADFVTVEPGMTDWAGNMAPPPIGSDWDNRKKHDATKTVSAIEAWRQAEAGSGLTLDIESPDFQTGIGHATGEQHVISHINQADHIALPNEDDFSQARRGQNAADAVDKFNARMRADGRSPQSEETEKKRSMTAEEKKAYNRARADEKNVPLPPSEFAPKANIYLRPAEAKDMRKCTEIYNFYVTETSAAPDLMTVTEAHWNARFQEAREEHNPFVVAIHLGQKRYANLRDVRRKNREDVVGFAVAADFGTQSSVYRYSVEIDMLVSPLHLRQGIGGTLLDRMLSALDPGYNLIERVPFLGDYMTDHWVGGGHCICKTVVVNILHDAADTKSIEWKKKWLSSDRNNFVHTGTLRQIGFRNKKP